MTDIDILLPFYGDVDFMKDAVHSVIDQQADSWRLLVFDDAYPDTSVTGWFQRLNHPAVEYHRNHHNLGANANYRHALEAARADYVVFMGADDVMLGTYLTTVLGLIKTHPTVDVFQPGVTVIDEAGNQVLPAVDRVKRYLAPRRDLTMQGETLARGLLLGNWTYFPSLCWKRSTITSIGFRHDLDVVQDLALLLDLVCQGGVLHYHRDPQFLYRRHAASDSSVRSINGIRFAEESRLFSEMAMNARDHGWKRAARAADLHLTSRLHAALTVPRCIGHRQWGAASRLAAHALQP